MIMDVAGDEPVARTLERVHGSGRTPYLVRGTTKRELLASFADALGFPEYFGMNLDALVDSLRDVEIQTPATIVWDDAETFADADRRTYETVRQILSRHLPDEVDVLLCLR